MIDLYVKRAGSDEGHLLSLPLDAYSLELVLAMIANNISDEIDDDELLAMGNGEEIVVTDGCCSFTDLDLDWKSFSKADILDLNDNLEELERIARKLEQGGENGLGIIAAVIEVCYDDLDEAIKHLKAGSYTYRTGIYYPAALGKAVIDDLGPSSELVERFFNYEDFGDSLMFEDGWIINEQYGIAVCLTV